MTLSPYTLGRDGFIASLDLPALMTIPPTLYLPVAMRRQGKPV